MTFRGRGLFLHYLKSLAVAGVVVAGIWAFAVAVDPDERQHLAGESRRLTVDVVDSTRGDGCGSRKRVYAVRYRVVGEMDLSTAEMCRKARPTAGRKEAWLTDGGEMRFDSPWAARAWLMALPFVIAALFTFLRQRGKRSSD